MIVHSFRAQSDSETKRIANFIETFNPKVNFILEESHSMLQITAKFNSEDEKNNFLLSLSSALNINENGSYLI
uniref:hypothetical protein n=1 Tax=Flavobacterium sp. TaxID=239 RepID=UPI004049E5B4